MPKTYSGRARTLILVAAFLSFLLSVGLYFLDDKTHGIFVGLWVPSILALGALRRAVAHGLTVPDDLTITGFDGVPEAERAGLTTVWQPVLEKGRTAGELLLERGDRIRPRNVTLPTELRVGRTSCAPRDAERWFSGL